ncbi:fibrinogen-like protein 1 [Nothobranchius furzeri]|uniref:fibrinogen-like protein 1 n=1 Tax=Nothobranchius furzeri TaxID=105023 RepID=UPI0039046670
MLHKRYSLDELDESSGVDLLVLGPQETCLGPHKGSGRPCLGEQIFALAVPKLWNDFYSQQPGAPWGFKRCCFFPAAKTGISLPTKQEKMKGLLSCCGLVSMLLLSISAQAETSALPADCTQIRTQSPQSPSGLYDLQPVGVNNRLKVFCEMRSAEGWIVIQKRTGGLLPFNRRWAEYRFGFGSLAYDHWLGLEKVYLLTKDETKKWTLRVDLWDTEGNTAYAEYRNFRLGDEQTSYKLQVGKYRGTAGDAIRGISPDMDENGFGFSTLDRDNDGCSPCLFYDILVEECIMLQGGGWWYSKCGSASLNGDWYSSGDHTSWSSGLRWTTWKTPKTSSFKATRMMIRPE